MNYRHFLLSGSLAITSLTTVALVAPAAHASNLVTSLPIQFVTTSGGFVPGAGAPNPVTGISATITGVGAGSTIPFNPTTGGAILPNFVAANAVGNYTFTGAALDDFFRFDLLSDGTSVFNSVIASGVGTVNGSFNLDLSSVVPAFANTNLVVQFSGGGATALTNHGATRLLITTRVPEPGTVAALGLLGAGLAASSVRKKFSGKTKIKI
jgi:PEP-CTERM motif